MITKRKLLKIFGTGNEIARQLGISRAAVAKWPRDRAIPPLRLLQLQALYPDRFGSPEPVEKKGFTTHYTPPGRAEERP